MTNKQKNDIECIKWFIPNCLSNIKITTEDEIKFLEYSDKGKHKDEVNLGAFTTQSNGFLALCEGKKWRGIHIHELYEPGVLEGSMPYYTLLGGFDGTKKRKWYKIWQPKYIHYHIPIPRVVVDFLKKEMFQGIDNEVIEKTYQKILLN